MDMFLLMLKASIFALIYISIALAVTIIPIFIFAKKWTEFRAKISSTPVLYDYTSCKVRSVASYMSGLLTGTFLIASALITYLYNEHPCFLQHASLYEGLGVYAAETRIIVDLAPAVFSILLACLSCQMFYIHFRQKTFEGNKPNSGFLLLGLCFGSFLAFHLLIVLQNATQSGGGCHGL